VCEGYKAMSGNGADTPSPPADANDARLLTRGSAALAIGQSVARAIAFGFLLVATRFLTPNQFGRYSIVAAVVLLVQIVSDAGTTVAITKHLSRHPEDSDALLSGTALMSLALGVAGYALAMAFVVCAGYAPVTTADMAIAGLALPFDALLTSVIGALDARGRMVERAWVSAARTSSAAVIGAIALVLGAGVRGPIVATALAPLIVLMVTLPLVRRWRIWWSRPRIDLERSRRLLRQALPFAIVGVINVFILRFDVVLVSLLTSRADTAIYDIATRSIEGVAYLGAVLGAPLMVVLSRRFAAGDREGSARVFAETCRVSWLLGFAWVAILVGSRVPIVESLFGSGFAASEIPLALLALQLPLLFITGLQGTVLAADSDERGLVIVSAWVGFATVALDVAVVPVFGAVGAAVVMIVVRCFAFGLFSWRVGHVGDVHTPRPAFGLLLAAAVGFLGGEVTAGAGIVVSIGIAAGGFVVTALLTRAVRASDLRDVRRGWSTQTLA
jgi:O-antigen/teichoic acid export membrane protein